MNWRNYLLCCGVLTAVVSNTVLAQPAAQPANSIEAATPPAITLDVKTDTLPVAHASRLVVFRYDANRSFAIRALKGVFVNVEVPIGETIQGFYLSDPTTWEYHVTGDDRRVLIKPTASAGVTTGTLVTTARSYELTLAAVDLGEPWYQRVQWQLPDAGAGLWEGQAQAGVGAAAAAFAIDPSKLHMGYRIIGKAAFAPTTVFDDGVRTWVRFERVQDMPAVFARRGKGVELLDYAMDPAACGACIVIPSVHDVIELRLGKQTVRLERRG